MEISVVWSIPRQGRQFPSLCPLRGKVILRSFLPGAIRGRHLVRSSPVTSFPAVVLARSQNLYSGLFRRQVHQRKSAITYQSLFLFFRTRAGASPETTT